MVGSARRAPCGDIASGRGEREHPSSVAESRCAARRCAGRRHVGNFSQALRRGGRYREVAAGVAILVLVCLSGCLEFAAGDGAADLNIPRRLRADDPTLQRAVDAYRQARQLDKQLKGSERAVEAQTRTLRGELKRSRVAESTSKDPAFRKEVRMDEDLLNQAETETRRDKQLVRQAEREMKGDKKFLEDAYRRDTRSNDCPSTACRDARALGQTPRACTISAQGDCPRINCMDYQETGRCSAGRVCSRPSSRAEGCDYGGNGPVSWTRRQCPGMHCAHARTAGYSPQFCTAMSGDGGCPQLACHRYERQTDCQGAPEQGFTTGHVCMRAERVAGCTHASAQNSLAAADTNMAAVSPMHDQHASKSIWSAPKAVESRMVCAPGRSKAVPPGMLTLLLFMSAGTIGAYILFRRNGVQRYAKKPAPVPAYYGRL